MTITEAAACGTPAVATRIAGPHRRGRATSARACSSTTRSRLGAAIDRVHRRRRVPRVAVGRRARARDAVHVGGDRARHARGARQRGPAAPPVVSERTSARPAERRPSAASRSAVARARAASATRCSRSPRTCPCCAAIRARSRPTRSSTSTSIRAACSSRAVSMWDPHIGMGTVTHQNIGYLFPMGPYYWVLDKLGVPDWVAQRLWLGSILFFAARRRALPAAHVRPARAGRRRRRARVHVHAVHARLLGAHLGAAAAVRGAAVDDRRSRARRCATAAGAIPAIFALVVQVIGGVNATALIFAGVGPVLWIAVRVARRARGRLAARARRHGAHRRADARSRRCGGSPGCGCRARTASTS